jgi:hypothetical protein
MPSKSVFELPNREKQGWFKHNTQTLGNLEMVMDRGRFIVETE